MKNRNSQTAIILPFFLLIGAIGFWPWGCKSSNDPVPINSVPVVKIAPNLYSGVLIVQTDGSQGSCFVVAQQEDWYYAITANHVIELSSLITVDEELYDAEIVRVDVEQDIALIRFQSSETYRIYTTAKARTEEQCTLMGWSSGVFLRYRGFIVATNYNGYVLANNGVLPGCSGGPLLNTDGNVIGVTVAVSVYYNWAFDSSILFVPSRFVDAMVVTIGE